MKTGKRLKVLAVADYYLPGFQAGGPIRTIVNIRQALLDQIEFDLVTRDRDLGMIGPYPGIAADRWLGDQGARLYYASPKAFGPKSIGTAIGQGDYDIIYLNSFFSVKGSILPNALLRRKAKGSHILIAPRGEFSPGALSLKPTKKKAFLALAKLSGLYRNVHWHVSSEAEKADLLRVFPEAGARVHIAADPVAISVDEHEHPPKTAGVLNLVFISRVSPKKNLDGLLAILKEVRRKVALAIHGPAEDKAYLRQCKMLCETLPPNISVTWNGAIAPDEVRSTFARHNTFAFPTLGENFGHVIFEALDSGTPVLISDTTMWEEDGTPALRVLPLHDRTKWVRAIEEAADRDEAGQRNARAAALAYAKDYASKDRGRKDTLAMFRRIAADRVSATSGS